MYAGNTNYLNLSEIEVISVDERYLKIKFWERWNLISVDIRTEKARELIEKLQAALPSRIAVHDGPPPIHAPGLDGQYFCQLCLETHSGECVKARAIEEFNGGPQQPLPEGTL